MRCPAIRYSAPPDGPPSPGFPAGPMPPLPPGQPPRTNAIVVGAAAIPPGVAFADLPPFPPRAPKLPPAPPPPPSPALLAPSRTTHLASSAPAPRCAFVLDASSVPVIVTASGATSASGREPIATTPSWATTIVSPEITQIVGPTGCACVWHRGSVSVSIIPLRSSCPGAGVAHSVARLPTHVGPLASSPGTSSVFASGDSGLRPRIQLHPPALAIHTQM